MAINKVVLGERTLIDLSLDTATEADVAKGKYFHRADGEIVEGTLEGSGGGGSGGGGGLVESDVNFYDYDGTLLYAYPRAGVMAMTELPEPPTHEGLTFQEWNWTLGEIKVYKGQVNVGATYITDDGKTRFYIRLTNMSQAYFRLHLNVSIKGDTVVINWGDGTGDKTYEIEAYNTSPYQNSNPRTFAHTYENLGDYVITVDSGENVALGYTGGQTLVGDSNIHPTANALYKIELGKVDGISCNALVGYRNLEIITMPRGVVIKNQTGSSRAFLGRCYSLKSIVFPRGFELYEESILQCYALRCAVLPGNGRIYQPKHAVNSCYSLSSFTVPSSIAAIADYFFAGTLAEKIHLHENITSIGADAFKNCYRLQEVDLPKAKSIGANAFRYCHNLKRVVLADSLTSIPDYAFDNCTNLEDINIPDGLTSIGAFAFNNCYRIWHLHLPVGVKTIGTSAFMNCVCLNGINIPEGVTSIGNSSFRGCSSITSINIPEGVTSIGASAFENCYVLKAIEIPTSVTSIGEKAFAACRGLESVNISEGLTSISGYAFQSCNALTAIEIPSSVTSIGSYAFDGCSSITSINIPEGVTSIGGYAFRGCKNLTAIEIPEGITALNSYVVSGCTALTALEIPAGVKSIANYAFRDCSGLRYIDFSKHTAVPTLSSTGAFTNTPADMEIRVPTALYDEWVAATNWSTYASKIVAV